MADWTPDERDDDFPEGGDADGGDDALGDEQTPVVRIVTAAPVAIRLVEAEHPRKPEGHTVFQAMGALEGDVTDESPILAQGSLPTTFYDAVQRSGLFDRPAPLLLTAQEDGEGLRATLAAIVPQSAMQRIEREQRAESEPWLASLVDSPRIGEEDEEPQAVPFLLGVILRFPEDRRHPGDLEREAVDLLGTLLSGGAMDADKKRVENLLKSL